MRDVAIVGGGHNGLVCAAYLARAGFDVEVVERRDVLGGAAVTEEPWPGYRVSSASLVCGQPDAAVDRARARAAPARLPHLDRLAGLLRPLPGPDGADRGDTERDSREIAQLSPADGEAYAEFDAHFDRAPRWVPDPHRGRKDGPAVLEEKGDAGRAQATARASPTIIPETVP